MQHLYNSIIGCITTNKLCSIPRFHTQFTMDQRKEFYWRYQSLIFPSKNWQSVLNIRCLV